MTRDDIIHMAREACDTDKVDAWHNDFWTITQEELERFAALIIAYEREDCAKICEAKSEHWWAKWKHQADLRDMGMADGADECAQAIRSRK